MLPEIPALQMTSCNATKSHWSVGAIEMTCLQALHLQRRMAQAPAENIRITTFRAKL